MIPMDGLPFSLLLFRSWPGLARFSINVEATEVNPWLLSDKCVNSMLELVDFIGFWLENLQYTQAFYLYPRARCTVLLLSAKELNKWLSRTETKQWSGTRVRLRGGLGACPFMASHKQAHCSVKLTGITCVPLIIWHIIVLFLQHMYTGCIPSMNAMNVSIDLPSLYMSDTDTHHFLT